MKGLELSRRYYEECGKPMLENEFAAILPYLAVGLCGSGSECFGYDDEISRDHDFEPGFCIFLPGEEIVSRRDAFLLERAYAKLPNEFLGFRRQRISPVGGNRHGVIRMADFFTEKVGNPDGDLSLGDWLHIPSFYLSEATNGEVYFDNYGRFSATRVKLSAMPEDVRKKRLAGRVLLAGQAGQYNFSRLISHGEQGAAKIALTEFVRSVAEIFYLLDRRYSPYYKWVLRGLKESGSFGEYVPMLEELLLADFRGREGEALQTVESLAEVIIDKLKEQSLTEAVCGDLEKHAYSVNDGISDASVRNLHILEAVSSL